MPKNNVTGQNRLGTQNTKIQKYKNNKIIKMKNTPTQYCLKKNMKKKSKSYQRITFIVSAVIFSGILKTTIIPIVGTLLF